jgi:hypothetical protein
LARKRVLVLFAQEWDRLALADPALAARYEVIHAGFDLFRFPENLRLFTFDARRFVDRMVRLVRRRAIAGVVSPHEQFGALIAAVVARRAGLPGPDPKAVVTAQHKYYARAAMARLLPETVPPFGAFPYRFRHPDELPLAFPFFVKPVKATFSVLARRVESLADLQRHLRFRAFERYTLERLIRPFNDLQASYPELTIDAHHLLAEGLMEGLQVNVDGYADRGEVRVLGVVDEVMYPGTLAFHRFEYPSSLPEAIRARLAAVARTAVQAVGFDHGVFNVELCYDPGEDSIQTIEINPRIASQFVTLYRWVDGVGLYDLMLSLAVGETPSYAPRPQPHAYAASFVLRSFDGRPVRPAPGRAQLRAVRQRHPDAHLMLYLKRGADLAREMKWLGSHRYAVVNLRGRDRADLYARYRDVRDTLGFGRHGGPEPAPMWTDRDAVAAPEPETGAEPG